MFRPAFSTNIEINPSVICIIHQKTTLHHPLLTQYQIRMFWKMKSRDLKKTTRDITMVAEGVHLHCSDPIR